MARGNRFVSASGARRIVEAVGVAYLILAAGWLLAPIPLDTTLVDDLVEFLLILATGCVLLYGGYRLPWFDVRPQFYPTVAKWTLGGIGVLLCLLGFYSLQPGEDVGNVAAVFILTGLAGIAGFAGGVHSAQAKTRASELEETVEQLQTANERLEHFAYAASHDLQEPLRMVSSYLRLLETRYEDDLDEEAHEFIEFAVDGADRMRAMVESLLEYSRVTTQGESFERTDTEEIFEGVLDDLQLRIEETGAEITTGELPTVVADPDQIAQVFQNLLSNAMQYSGDEPPRIHVGAERTGEAWLFSVADDGIGIDPEYHDRIFNVFERLGTTPESAERGAGGIGLALCERIVERHGGDIWVESTPGEGATFYFSLPASAEELPLPPEQAAVAG
ncbi:histidine kinase [Natronomonas salina]|uniref:sensor histidine kinase n=1 Tax=Natronomonas salina TaxID=1710540 RepID=UPI0015B56D89|nr:ATP-binding protein [Natronomonas salina]QLD90471.1 histidine kinase [Natronomonas salina]